MSAHEIAHLTIAALGMLGITLGGVALGLSFVVRHTVVVVMSAVFIATGAAIVAWSGHASLLAWVPAVIGGGMLAVAGARIARR